LPFFFYLLRGEIFLCTLTYCIEGRYSDPVNPKQEGGIPLTIVVEVQESLEKALKVLKKKMQLDGLQRELKNRRFYEKPSVKKRRKMQEAERRRRKARRRRS
jgi:small subunit ribosomal protein S21